MANRRYLSAGISLLALTLVAGPSVAETGSEVDRLLVSEQPSPGIVEALENPPEKLGLAWVDIPTARSIAQRSDTAVTLNVENLAEDFRQVELVAIADAGDGRQRVLRLRPLALGPVAPTSVRVDLSAFGFDLAAMQFSGRLHVTARLGDESEPGFYQTDSAALYFHPASAGGDSLVLYGEQALIDEFRSGDFMRRIPDAVLHEEGVVTDRVTFGGAGEVSARVLSDAEILAGELGEKGDEE